MVKIIGSMLVAATLMQSAWALELKSDDIKPGAMLDQQQVFNGFGCSGGNQSPALTWSDVPPGTKSFALTVYDPDAPTGSGWWHWVVFNIPADTRSLLLDAGNPKGDKLPVGAVQSRTDFGAYGYGGACPPTGHGKHRYQFKLYALGVESLNLDKNASAALVGFMLHQNTLDSAMIEAVFER